MRIYSIYFSDGLLDEADNELIMRAPRDTYNSRGEFTLPPKVIVSENVSEREFTLNRSINRFLKDSINKEYFPPSDLNSAIEVSKFVIGITKNIEP